MAQNSESVTAVEYQQTHGNGLAQNMPKKQDELDAAKAKIATLEKQLAELADVRIFTQKWYEDALACRAEKIQLQVQAEKLKSEAPKP